MDLLTLNCGSATVKAARYRLDADGHVPAEAERRVLVDAADGVAAAVAGVLDDLLDGGDEPVAIGHRVVHGGPDRTDPVVIDDEGLAQLTELVPLSPIHQPPAHYGVHEARLRFPRIPQVACFDTAFHRTMGEVERTLPLPRRLIDGGVQRYGFHGLSYEYVVGHLGAELPGRAVIAHLGSGASLCAVRNGCSVATTMGFTPTAGVVMGTRSGDVDPGALVHAMRTEGLDADGLEHLVDRESGLLGISGRSNDLRVLATAAEAGDHHARVAIEVFCRSVRHAVAGLATDLDGLEALVFTAGIGEHSPLVRSEVCKGLGHLGVEIDATENTAGASVVSTPASRVVVRVVATDEEQVIARHTAALLSTNPAP